MRGACQTSAASSLLKLVTLGQANKCGLAAGGRLSARSGRSVPDYSSLVAGKGVGLLPGEEEEEEDAPPNSTVRRKKKAKKCAAGAAGMGANNLAATPRGGAREKERNNFSALSLAVTLCDSLRVSAP